MPPRAPEGRDAEERASPNAEGGFVHALSFHALGRRRGGRTGPANAAQGQWPEAPRSPRRRDTQAWSAPLPASSPSQARRLSSPFPSYFLRASGRKRQKFVAWEPLIVAFSVRALARQLSKPGAQAVQPISLGQLALPLAVTPLVTLWVTM